MSAGATTAQLALRSTAWSVATDDGRRSLTGQIGQPRWASPRGALRSALLRGALFFTIVALLVVGVAPLSAAEPPARLSTVSGTVAVTFADGSAVQPAGSGTGLGAGDRIATVGRSAATVELPGIGPAKLAAYGDELVSLVRGLAAEPAAGPTDSSSDS